LPQFMARSRLIHSQDLAQNVQCSILKDKGMRSITPLLLVSVLALAGLMSACSGGDGVQRLPAISLETGEIDNFFKGDLPDGWAFCSDPSCNELAGQLSCAQRGPSLCEVDDRCWLRPLSCATDEALVQAQSCSSFPGQSTDGSTQDCPAGSLPDCEYSCVEARLLYCDELVNTELCASRSDCQWSSNDGRCEAVQRCPDVALVEAADCPPGATVPLFDASGCLLGTRCLTDCPEVAAPRCSNETEPTPIVDQRSGCVIGYECDSVIAQTRDGGGGTNDLAVSQGYYTEGNSTTSSTEACDSLVTRYASTLLKAKACTPGRESTVGQPGDVSSCATTMPNALTCGCPTYVNAEAQEAIDALNELRRRWTALGCELSVYCAPVACYAPTGGACSTDDSSPVSADGLGSGTCQDLL
jgi:hypothetical protein